MPEDWLDEVAELLQILNDRGDVEFLELVKGDLQIRISRGAMSVTRDLSPLGGERPAPIAPPPPVPPRPVPPLATPGSTAARPVLGTEEREGTQLVRSPMVGTFYRASGPGVPPYVEVGATVTPESTMGLIEAMKVYTAVHCGVAGVVEEIFAENAEFVQFEQPLFRVRLG